MINSKKTVIKSLLSLAGIFFPIVVLYFGEILQEFLLDNNNTQISSVFIKDSKQKSDSLNNLLSFSSNDLIDKENKPEKKLIKGPDIKNGEEIFKRECSLCHTVSRDVIHKTGPSLWNIAFSKIARFKDFNYSKALLGRKNENWSLEKLDKFIFDPNLFIEGTKMAFSGLKKDKDRLDILAYLSGVINSNKDK